MKARELQKAMQTVNLDQQSAQAVQHLRTFSLAGTLL
jgi:hypothetical protein